MNSHCLSHCLTTTEAELFERNGYLVVENALEPSHTEYLRTTVDRLQNDGRLSRSQIINVKGRVDHPDFLSLDQAFLDLLDFGFKPVSYLPGWFLRGPYRFDCVELIAGLPPIRSVDSFIERAVAKIDEGMQS